MLAAGLNCLEFCNPQALKLENAILGDNEFLSVLHDLVFYTLCIRYMQMSAKTLLRTMLTQ